jgi:hypothetical protein
MSTAFLLLMLVGYLMTITVETAVLLALLSRRHPVRVKVFAGVWLTACTYPVVWIVLPPLFEERWLYLLVAETFAPAAECALFWFAFVRRLPPSESPPEDDVWWIPPPLRRPEWFTLRDFVAITLANLASFGLGEVINHYHGFEWIVGGGVVGGE